jgi:pyrimidine operon attenuation protein/uracil phosphoribosyltransferase
VAGLCEYGNKLQCSRRARIFVISLGTFSFSSTLFHGIRTEIKDTEGYEDNIMSVDICWYREDYCDYTP